jgi:hypothetical protein
VRLFTVGISTPILDPAEMLDEDEDEEWIWDPAA